jgi:beta-lactamase superfamily II metal-dependent hydrolase
MSLQGEMRLRIWDVEHGACAMLHHQMGNYSGRLAMIDSGCTGAWRPSRFIRNDLKRQQLDYLYITNADQDHMSDLQGLWDAGINVPVVHRNPSPSVEDMRKMKEVGGPLTKDAQRFLNIHQTYIGNVTDPFNTSMGGITATCFWNTYPRFQDTNNLSLTVFIQYGNFKILFPGDLEKIGWEGLLEQPNFVRMLPDTDVLVASHHGRESGFCSDIFNHFTPSAVVISDKPIQHETQRMVPDYRAVVRDKGVRIATTMKDRHVLTTRRDGSITFFVDQNGYRIETECRG